MNHGWIGACAGMLLAGISHAQPAPADPASSPGEPPAAAAEVPRSASPAPIPWPEPPIPAYGTLPPGTPPAPPQVIRIANPPPQRLPAQRRPPDMGQVIDMPTPAPSWYDRFRPGRWRGEAPVNVPVTPPMMAPQGSPTIITVPQMAPQATPTMTTVPQMLPEVVGDNVIMMEKASQNQLPPAPGEVPPSSGSPTEPLQQLPQPRSLDATEPLPVAEFNVPPGQWWFGVEALLWFVEQQRLPIPLLTTTSSAGATATSTTGALSSSSTQVLVDSEALRSGHYPGARFSVGYWFAPERIFGLEANVFFSQASEIELGLLSSGITSGVLSRPFANATNGSQQAAVVTFPVTQTGSVDITADSRLLGGELNLTAKFIRGVASDWDLIAGLRCLVLDEALDIQQLTVARTGNNMRFLGAPVAAGSLVTAFDRFDTRNRFTGAQFGIRKEDRLANMVLACQFKVAAGVTRQTIDIDGGSSKTTAGTTTTAQGGVLALPTNIGQVVTNDFTFVPQLQLTLGYQCLENLRFWASYECLMWTNVARPGSQIDPVVNPMQMPTTLGTFNPAAGPARPSVPLDQESLFLQGISFGMEMKY